MTNCFKNVRVSISDLKVTEDLCSNEVILAEAKFSDTDDDNSEPNTSVVAPAAPETPELPPTCSKSNKPDGHNCKVLSRSQTNSVL